MFRSREEIAEILASSHFKVMIAVLIVCLLLIALSHRETRKRVARKVLHVRGYVRPTHHGFEYGLHSIDNDRRLRLGWALSIELAHTRLMQEMRKGEL